MAFQLSLRSVLLPDVLVRRGALAQIHAQCISLKARCMDPAEQVHALQRGDASRHRSHLHSVVPSPIGRCFRNSTCAAKARTHTVIGSGRTVRQILARGQARATLSMTFTGAAAKVIGTRRCWARGASTLDRSRATTGKLSAFARFLWRLWMRCCLRAHRFLAYSKQLASKPLRLPSSSGKEALGSDIISDAGHQHESTQTMVNFGMCYWCANCHRIPPAAASARRTSSATTKQHKYLTMFMCIYESAPGTQRQQHEPICMCVVRR